MPNKDFLLGLGSISTQFLDNTKQWTLFEQNGILFPSGEHFGAVTCPNILGVRRVICNPDIASNGAQL